MVWLAVLCIFVSGCAGYRPASLPGSNSPDEIGGSETVVEVGAEVKLEKRTGDVVSGRVMRISDTFIVLETSGNTGFSEFQIEFDQISSLEVRKGSSSIPILLVGAVLAVVVVAVVMAATMENVAEVTF